MWKINVHNIIKFIFEREQGDLSNLEAHCEAILSIFCFQGKKCTEKWEGVQDNVYKHIHGWACKYHGNTEGNFSPFSKWYLMQQYDSSFWYLTAKNFALLLTFHSADIWPWYGEFLEFSPSWARSFTLASFLDSQTPNPLPSPISEDLLRHSRNMVHFYLEIPMNVVIKQPPGRRSYQC